MTVTTPTATRSPGAVHHSAGRYSARRVRPGGVLLAPVLRRASNPPLQPTPHKPNERADGRVRREGVLLAPALSGSRRGVYAPRPSQAISRRQAGDQSYTAPVAPVPAQPLPH